MSENEIRYGDGAAYERMMGTWSRAAGELFLDWLAPRPDLRWIDVGCGSGAFTELIINRCAPSAVTGVDPSPAQLLFARERPARQTAKFHQGNALSLPFSEASFDAAVMALVIFFVPDPAKGVAEMARVVCPGGTVAAYVWDMTSGGHPLHPLHSEMKALGLSTPMPPRSEVTSLAALEQLWRSRALDRIETRKITVQRTFVDFEDYWTTSILAATVAPTVAAMDAEKIGILKARTRARLVVDSTGRIICTAHANAIRGIR